MYSRIFLDLATIKFQLECGTLLLLHTKKNSYLVFDKFKNIVCQIHFIQIMVCSKINNTDVTFYMQYNVDGTDI